MSKLIKSVHEAVLLKETIDSLNISSKDIYLDGTLGGAGHFISVLEKGVKLAIGLDRDEDAIARARANIEEKGFNNYLLFNEDYRMMDKTLIKAEIDKVDKILLDLGISSDQLSVSGRGFSFLKNEPLLMTFKRFPLPNDLTAEKIVNTWDEENIADIIYGWGEERFSRRIARAIVERRQKAEIRTTFDLVEIIESAVPRSYRMGRIHPATRTFQALRIATNDELGSLKEGLTKGLSILNEGGRIAVISFHSLEDRVVKRFFIDEVKKGVGILINKKPIIASVEELKNNPRARSAKLRIFQKI